MSGIDLTQFYQAFFDEADDLLANMESLLLELDVAQPDSEQLNAIFRAAHSIKGGAATFGCFEKLAQTTHLMENLLDAVRQGQLPLRADMIDVFLQAKDVLKHQLDDYRNNAEPDEAEFLAMGERLRALRQQGAASPAPVPAAAVVAPAVAVPVGGAAVKARPEAVVPALPSEIPAGEAVLRVAFSRVSDKDAQTLLEELGNLGQVLSHEASPGSLVAMVQTSCAAADIEAVSCFIVNADQIDIQAQSGSAAPAESAAAQAAAVAAAVVETAASANTTAGAALPATAQAHEAGLAGEPQAATAAPAGNDAAARGPGATAAAAEPARRPPARGNAGHDKESGSLRVDVGKVDQVINLVGELVITQAMLTQTASTLDPVEHDGLLGGLGQLERNVRELQEAIMSMRMIPMEYVFSRFPRVIRDLSASTGKKIKLETIGKATELDKSLIERIIDPLTHLVRNSLDHGIEMPEERLAAGKSPEGCLTLAAQHQGGNIVIEVRDDGRGLDRAKILAKAHKSGLLIADNAPDEDVWQLIFAPGFSTAEQVTAISGRGVGMDVVRRNIQAMGGHVQLLSQRGKGTTTRIVLPLTLAILDGMSVQVGNEIFILPLNNVMESIQPRMDQLRSLTGEERLLKVRDDYLPLVEMSKVFAIEGAQADPSRAIAVVLQAQGRCYALLVDHLIGQHQVVVKNLETNYRKVPGIAAATILGDGRVALIVDVFALAGFNREPWSRPALASSADAS
ncbi:chemotaxis protein CheA [Bordetella sp. J329]|nr:chemotaxis protein CheA [Bordetella sp. J329]